MREKKVYYIKSSKENPEGVRQALLEVCPDAKNIDDFAYSFAHSIDSTYYYVINGRIDYAEDDSRIELLKDVGIELQPKTQEKVEFVEEVMYHSVFFTGFKNEVYESYRLYETIEEATNSKDAVGYRAVKIMIKKD